MSFVEAHRHRFGVEPICKVLKVAPSTFYAAACRPASKRRQRDAVLKEGIARVHKENFEVYGIEKVWRQLNREGISVGRDRVARLMRKLGLGGARRGKIKRTTVAPEVGVRPADLVDRQFTAVAPNRLWVADLTYVSTWTGFVYTAFVVDAFSRYIVGWRVSSSLRAGRSPGRAAGKPSAPLETWSRAFVHAVVGEAKLPSNGGSRDMGAVASATGPARSLRENPEAAQPAYRLTGLRGVRRDYRPDGGSRSPA